MDQDQGAIRIAPVDLNQLTPEQAQAVATLETGPAGIQGPFLLLLHNPSLMAAAFPAADRLRFGSILSDRHRELATLVAAQVWRQGFEWAVHAPLAQQAGLPPEAITAIGRGERPQALAGDDLVIYEFCRQLHADKQVDDGTYAKAAALLGADGVMELCWLSGFYASLAMVMNVAQMPPQWSEAIDCV